MCIRVSKRSLTTLNTNRTPTHWRIQNWKTEAGVGVDEELAEELTRRGNPEVCSKIALFKIIWTATIEPAFSKILRGAWPGIIYIVTTEQAFFKIFPHESYHIFAPVR